MTATLTPLPPLGAPIPATRREFRYGHGDYVRRYEAGRHQVVQGCLEGRDELQWEFIGPWTEAEMAEVEAVFASYLWPEGNNYYTLTKVELTEEQRGWGMLPYRINRYTWTQPQVLARDLEHLKARLVWMIDHRNIGMSREEKLAHGYRWE